MLKRTKYKVSPIFYKKSLDSIPAVSKLRLNASPSGKYHSKSEIHSVGIRSNVASLIIFFVIVIALGGNFKFSNIGM